MLILVAGHKPRSPTSQGDLTNHDEALSSSYKPCHSGAIRPVRYRAWRRPAGQRRVDHLARPVVLRRYRPLLAQLVTIAPPFQRGEGFASDKAPSPRPSWAPEASREAREWVSACAG